MLWDDEGDAFGPRRPAPALWPRGPGLPESSSVYYNMTCVEFFHKMPPSVVFKMQFTTGAPPAPRGSGAGLCNAGRRFWAAVDKLEREHERGAVQPFSSQLGATGRGASCHLPLAWAVIRTGSLCKIEQEQAGG